MLSDFRLFLFFRILYGSEYSRMRREESQWALAQKGRRCGERTCQAEGANGAADIFQSASETAAIRLHTVRALCWLSVRGIGFYLLGR